MRHMFGIFILAIAAVIAFAAAMSRFRGLTPSRQPRRPGLRHLRQTPASNIWRSTGAFTRAQITDRFGPADWYPGDHPTMPDIVAHGKKPDVRACALCHYPNGKGRPENAGVAGLPVAYFIQQMNDFRNGNRKSAEPRKANTNAMITIAKGMTDDEIKAAAEYFGSMKWTPWIKVVETSTVPKTRIAAVCSYAEGAKKNRSASVLSRCRRTRKPPRCFAIRDPASSPTRRPAASRKVRRWDQGGGKPSSAPLAMERI